MALIQITIDTTKADDLAGAAAMIAALQGTAHAVEPAKPARRQKTPEPPVAGNPDAPGPTGPAPAVEPATPASPPAAAAVQLPPPTKEELGKEVRRLADINRKAVVDALEKFRPAGYTAEQIKLTAIPTERWPELQRALADLAKTLEQK